MNGNQIIHMNFARLYRFKGVTFEWHRYLGPVILNRHTEKERDYRNVSLRIWSIVSKFSWLSDEEKAKYKINK